MCGRYTLAVSAKELWDEFELEGAPPADASGPRYNVSPSQTVPVITNREPKQVENVRWGLIPSWAKDMSVGYKMINARSESLTERPAYRVAFAKRRCLILADGFYEWRKEGKAKQPFYFHLTSGRPFGFAGLWESWKTPEGERLLSCAIITAKAEGAVGDVHGRMPIILPVSARAAWLAEGSPPKEELMDILAHPVIDEIECWPVAKLVNSPSNQGPSLVERIDPLGGTT